jgi:hypothetical protein
MTYTAKAAVCSKIRIRHSTQSEHHVEFLNFNLLAPEFFFIFLAHPVYKIWIAQEPKKVALWNKRHFEEKEKESVQHV